MMNDSTKPNRASASIRPMPMNIVPRTMPAASGWRAIASTDFPMRMPIPMPGPMAARPYTSPLPIAVRLPVVSAIRPTTWVTTPIIDSSLVSMLFRHRTRDVRSGQYGKDERLQPRHEDLEPHQCDPEPEGHQPEDVRKSGHQGERSEEEHREQEVPRNHVREKTDRQGEGTDQDYRDELDGSQQRIQPPGRPGREQNDLHVPEEAMTLDPDRVEGDPRDQGHHDGERDARVQREAHNRDDLEDVPEEDEEVLAAINRTYIYLRTPATPHEVLRCRLLEWNSENRREHGPHAHLAASLPAWRGPWLEMCNSC